jgi:hypothetical protein
MAAGERADPLYLVLDSAQVTWIRDHPGIQWSFRA